MNKVQEPKMDPRVKELLDKQRRAKEVRREIRSRIVNLVENLREEYAEHEDVIRDTLEGEAQRLLSEHEKKIREERERARVG